MHIRVTRRGGLAGIPMRGELETTELPSPVTVAVKVSMVVLVPMLADELMLTASGGATCTKTVVTAVPTPPLLSVAVKTTVYVSLVL